MKPTKLLAGLLSVALFLHAVRADDEDAAAEKAIKDANEAARKAATQAGITLPDMGKDADDEKTETPQKSGPAVMAPLKALPSWIPTIPGFTLDPKAEKKTQDGIESATVTGTSTSTPNAIADAMHAVAKEKMNFEQQDSNINGKITLTVHISDRVADGRDVEVTMKPGKVTSLEIIYKMPVAAVPEPAK